MDSQKGGWVSECCSLVLGVSARGCRYQWDHRNASLRKWIVEEFMMGKKLGMGNESVSGIYIDDWWSPGGPSEVQGLEAGTGLAKGSQEFIDIWTNWSVTTWQAQAAIAAAGGRIQSYAFALSFSLLIAVTTSPLVSAVR